MIRGRFRSRDIEDVVKEAEGLAERGVKELNVIAQDTTRFGEDKYGKPMLAELLRRLCRIDGFKWIRVLYCYPDRITDELIDTIASEDKIVKYMDIPLQHCNKDILRRMNRHGDRESLTALMNKIKDKIPNVIFRSTFITGFPGETEEQFNELAEFAADMKFQRLGCLPTLPRRIQRQLKCPTRLMKKSSRSVPILLWSINSRLWLNTAKALLAKKLKFLLKALTSLPNVSSAEAMPTPPRLTVVYSSPVTVKAKGRRFCQGACNRLHRLRSCRRICRQNRLSG